MEVEKREVLIVPCGIEIPISAKQVTLVERLNRTMWN